MRFKQIQRLNSGKGRYRRYKSGKSWRTAFVALVGASCFGTALLIKPVTANAATAVPTTTVSPSSTTVVTSATINTVTAASVAPSSANAATSSVTSSASVATSGTGSATSAASSTASTSSSVVMSSSTTAASSSVSTSPSAAMISSTSAVSSAATSNGSQSSSATNLTSGATTSSSASGTVTTAVSDDTVVTFGDAGIAAAVKAGLGVTGPVTIGDIRNYKGTDLNIGTDDNLLMVNGTLAGMQDLQYLPKTALVSLATEYANPNIDLTPLIPVRFNEVGIMIQDMSAANLAPLTKIDPSQIDEVQLVSSVIAGNSDYQKNNLGLTNAQLAQLGPWLTAIDNNDTYKSFNFDEGSLTNFSPLSGFTKAAYIVAVGQRLNVSQPVNLVIGQPAVFTPTPLTGIMGEDLTSKYEVTWNGTNSADPTISAAETPLTKLADGRFEIPTAYQAVPNADWFTYGFHGLINYNGNRADFITANYPNSITLRYDSMVYQIANWQQAPQVYIRYVDSTNNTLIQPYTVSQGTSIGATYDLTPQTRLAGYTFSPQTSSAVTGSYTQDPQFLTFQFEKNPAVAAGITIQYVDPDGQAIAPPTVIHGNEGDAYTSQPLTISNYTYRQTTAASLAPSGTLPLMAGTITYEYVPTVVQRTINYIDTTTHQQLASTTVTGAYQSQLPNPTLAPIKAYLAAGYRLVSNDFPTTVSPFVSDALTKTYTVQLAQQIETLRPGDTLPAKMVLQRVVTETVHFDYPNKTVAAPTRQQRVLYTRTATLNLVTGAIHYSAWQSSGLTTFVAVVPPTVTNYRSDLARLNAIPVNADSSDLVKTVIYEPKKAELTVTHREAETKQSTGLLTEKTGAVAAVPVAATVLMPAQKAGRQVGQAKKVMQPLIPKRVQAGQLPQTSEQRPTDIWDILGLTLIGLLGAMRIRKNH